MLYWWTKIHFRLFNVDYFVWVFMLKIILKRDSFQVIVIFDLIYGSTAWTLTKWLETKLDRTYVRILSVTWNISWKEHHTQNPIVVIAFYFPSHKLTRFVEQVLSVTFCCGHQNMAIRMCHTFTIFQIKWVGS